MESIVRTARQTGAWYLGLGITGMLGFLVIRSRLHDPDDPASTLAQLLDHELVARTGVVLELGVVVTQALVALWFFRLFRGVSTFAAGSLAAFGLVNAVAILVSAACLATALDVALDTTTAPGGDGAATVQLLYAVSDNLWGVGAVFFGLWLVPMGWLVLRSGWMPAALGWVLIVGGAGYVLSAVVHYLLPDAQVLADVLTVPASVGEFWMIGYLLLRGVRVRDTETPAPVAAA